MIPDMDDDQAVRRLVINPEPLRLVPAEQRWMSGLRGARSREDQKRVWVALGGDPTVWENEHPPDDPAIRGRS